MNLTNTPFRRFLPAIATILWTAGAGCILVSGANGLTAGGAPTPPADSLELSGSLAFLLSTLLLFDGNRHKTVLTVMAIWFASSVMILASPASAGYDTVNLARVVGVAIAAALSFGATERDYLRQKYDGAPPALYPQLLPFLILFVSGLPFIGDTFPKDNTLYKAASILTALGDLSFAFSYQRVTVKASS